ncbi:MAG TPA: phenylalanine--tRNA ligase subunit beta [Candidatus Dormibacteraeota bacterium]|nr:phenylalanine--tRNA ligase subunit beta [Candidatus Dormibacteraeota bacterium]
MTLRISMEWLQEYIELAEQAEELAEALTLSGTEVEQIVDLGVGWDGVVVARIVEARLVPGSDHLKVLQLEVGEDRVQVVSGAPNIAAGDLVPLAPPGTKLPNGMTVGARKFMQTASEGMVLSALELGISSEHDGILVLGQEGESGVPLSELMPRDRVLVVETTSNRPDLLCHLGIARELAAIYDRPIKDWHGTPREDGGPSPIGVEILDDDLCARYQARHLDGVSVGPSPSWMQRRLRAVGQRPISNAVDAANYAMLETGQPLHVFDYDKLKGGIVVRRALGGEQLLALDGKTRTLTPEMLVIADEAGPIALAGIIGGLDSAVSATTSKVVVEAANFLGTNVRATSRKLALRTDASTRFEKQLHPELVPMGSRRVVELLQDIAEAGPAAEVAEVYAHPMRNQPIAVRPGFVGEVLGDAVGDAEVERDLRRLGFKVEAAEPGLRATPPPYRLDVKEPVDLVEEVGRLRGYNSIPSTLPGRRLPVARVMPAPDVEWAAKDIAVGAGFDEVIVQSFVAPDEPRVGSFPTTRLRLANPMASDQSTMRTTLLPGLARVLAHNAASGAPGARVFELGHVFWPREAGELPEEPRLLGLGIHLGASGPQVSPAAVRTALLELKGTLQMLVGRLSSIELESEQVEVPGLHPGRSLRLRLAGQEAGALGQLHPEIAAGFESDIVVVAELNFEPVAANPRLPRAEAVSRHPAVLRDLAITVPELTPARDAINTILGVSEVILRSVDLYDEYRGRQVDPGRKGLTFRLTFQAGDRTLTGEEVSAAEARILHSLKAEIDALPRA